MPPKRDLFSSCARCGASFQQSGIGRMRRFCSDACKMASHRSETSTPRQSRRTTVKIELRTMERVAGFFLARGDYSGHEAIMHLASQVFVELDARSIESYRKHYQANLPDWFRPQVGAGQNVTMDDSASVTKWGKP